MFDRLCCSVSVAALAVVVVHSGLSTVHSLLGLCFAPLMRPTIDAVDAVSRKMTLLLPITAQAFVLLHAVK